MADLRNQPGCDLVVVAPRTWQAALLQELSLATGQTAICYDNAYEAMAAVGGVLRLARGAMVVAVVDTLDRMEMEIFSCLAGEKAVKTIAMSIQQREGKLATAMTLGAHEAVMSLKDSVILNQWSNGEGDELLLPETANLEATRLTFEKTSVLEDAGIESDLMEQSILPSMNELMANSATSQARQQVARRRRPPASNPDRPSEPAVESPRSNSPEDKIDLTSEELDALLGKDSEE